jgi:hypothetical protein
VGTVDRTHNAIPPFDNFIFSLKVSLEVADLQDNLVLQMICLGWTQSQEDRIFHEIAGLRDESNRTLLQHAMTSRGVVETTIQLLRRAGLPAV